MLSVLGEFDTDDVLPFVGEKGTPRKEYTVGENTFNLKMTSLRLRTFKVSPKCVICELVGTKILLEKNENDGYPHFNLYGEGMPSDIFMSHPPTIAKSNLVLFTKDHIVPRSVGGKDDIANMQTMCVICNQLKKNSSLNNILMKILRRFHDENIAMEKKEFIAALDDKRKLMSIHQMKFRNS